MPSATLSSHAKGSSKHSVCTGFSHDALTWAALIVTPVLRAQTPSHGEVEWLPEVMWRLKGKQGLGGCSLVPRPLLLSQSLFLRIGILLRCSKEKSRSPPNEKEGLRIFTLWSSDRPKSTDWADKLISSPALRQVGTVRTCRGLTFMTPVIQITPRQALQELGTWVSSFARSIHHSLTA